MNEEESIQLPPRLDYLRSLEAWVPTVHATKDPLDPPLSDWESVEMQRYAEGLDHHLRRAIERCVRALEKLARGSVPDYLGLASIATCVCEASADAGLLSAHVDGTVHARYLIARTNKDAEEPGK